MNDHNLLREMLKDVEPDWQGHVLSGDCEYAEGEGDPDKINAANRLYALWERQGTESREDLSCDTEHAESEEEEQEEEDNEIARRSIVERMFKNVSWDTIGEDARANLYYYALDHGLLAETLEEQERQGTASGQDAPLHGLQPGRMSHGSSDEELVCDHCRREIRVFTRAPCIGADIFFTGIAFGHTCKNITTVHQSRPSLHRPSRLS